MEAMPAARPFIGLAEVAMALAAFGVVELAMAIWYRAKRL
jgi:hypothetical protein